MNGVLGWDIGGVNTKVARVARGEVLDVQARVFEIQRQPHGLRPLLVELACAAGAQSGDAHAVTMTAELSQAFRTKREGVRFVLDHVLAAFPDALVRVHTVDGRFIAAADACEAPLAVAAGNWAATARLVAQSWPDAVLMDVGSTTTDITPIVTLRGKPTGVAAEGFALAGDVHLWRGQLAPSDYSVPTPDGRPATREFAGERLARVVCADREMLDEGAISAIADSLWEAQVDRVARAV